MVYWIALGKINLQITIWGVVHTFGSCKGSYHHSLECHLCKGRFMRDFLHWFVICPVILGYSWATTLFPFHLTHRIANYILPCYWGSLSNPLTLPETNIKSTLKMDGWNTSYLPFGMASHLQGLCHVSFRECVPCTKPERKPFKLRWWLPGNHRNCPKHPTPFFLRRWSSFFSMLLWGLSKHRNRFLDWDLCFLLTCDICGVSRVVLKMIGPTKINGLDRNNWIFKNIICTNVYIHSVCKYTLHRWHLLYHRWCKPS